MLFLPLPYQVGVALSEGRRDGLNWRVLLKTFLGWIWTILLSLGFCAILFCMVRIAGGGGKYVRTHKTLLVQSGATDRDSATHGGTLGALGPAVP